MALHAAVVVFWCRHLASWLLGGLSKDGGVTVQAVVPGARLGGSGEKSLRSCDFVNDCSKRIRAG